MDRADYSGADVSAARRPAIARREAQRTVDDEFASSLDMLVVIGIVLRLRRQISVFSRIKMTAMRKCCTLL
jgi:hypothetical protein